ncbi:MAG: FG-GAP-like repeat-containing protein, partial [Flavobacteriales bacterium]
VPAESLEINSAAVDLNCFLPMLVPLHRCVALCSMLLSLVCPHTHAQFTDNTLNSGIFIGNEVGIWGNGMSAFDFNSDGFDDLTIAENLSGIALYQSEGDGSFELTDFVALNAVIKQVMWVDFDNDDDADLFATTNGSGLFLYERMEDGSLFYRAELFSQYAQFEAQGASWEDYDKDG